MTGNEHLQPLQRRRLNRRLNRGTGTYPISAEYQVEGPNGEPDGYVRIRLDQTVQHLSMLAWQAHRNAQTETIFTARHTTADPTRPRPARKHVQEPPSQPTVTLVRLHPQGGAISMGSKGRDTLILLC